MDFKRDQAVPGLFLAVLVVVLGADIFLGRYFAEAIRSDSFDTTPGVVTKSEMGRDSQRKPRFDVEYTYTVNGRQYTGTKYHVWPRLVGNKYWFAARDAHPVGTPVTVYFDPDDPTNAYLSPGLGPDALFIAWFLAPFNLIMVGAVWAAWCRRRRPRCFDPALRRCVSPTRDGWWCRPHPQNRFRVVAFVALLLIMFVGYFAVGAYVLLLDFPHRGCCHS
jgi:hypothetical protein